MLSGSQGASPGKEPVVSPEPIVPSTRLAEPARSTLEDLEQRVHARLQTQLDLAELRKLPEGERQARLREVVEHLIEQDTPFLHRSVRDQLVANLLDEVLGLGPLEKLLRDGSVSDILINGPREVFVERGGRLEEVELHFRDNDHLLQVIDRIVSRVGRRVDDTSPMVDARLPDGSRVNAVIPPLALKGPTLSIRRFGATPLVLEDLLRLGALTLEMAQVLEAVVRAKLNVIVSGGTGSGKTTLLNTLSAFIPDGERVVTIEDAAELRLQQRHVVPLETRAPNVEGKGGVGIRDLVRNALRMRPDRIVIGECRGAEALDMLQAMNSGHEGSITTLHANSPRDALSRLETMILMGGFEMPLKAMRRQVTSAINLIVQAERLQGGPRKVTAVTEVVGMEGDVIVTQEIFVYQQLGVDPRGRAYGQFVTTGVRPKFAERVRAAGVELPANLFQQRVLRREAPSPAEALPQAEDAAAQAITTARSRR
jgi:pilus assembly protein CpaF